jgi:hypothetical protein
VVEKGRVPREARVMRRQKVGVDAMVGRQSDAKNTDVSSLSITTSRLLDVFFEIVSFDIGAVVIMEAARGRKP